MQENPFPHQIVQTPPQMNEILLRQGRKLDLGRALLGLGGMAEEVRGRRLAEQSLVERVQAGAVVVRAFGLKIGV